MTGQCWVEKFKQSEPCYVETVKLLGHEHGNQKLNKVAITFRVPVSIDFRLTFPGKVIYATC